MKERINPESVDVRWTLASARGKSFSMWAVVINGTTVAQFSTREAAWEYVYDRYEVPRHEGT